MRQLDTEGRVETKKEMRGGKQVEEVFWDSFPWCGCLRDQISSDKEEVEELGKGVIIAPGGKQRQGNHPPINVGRVGLHRHCLQLGPPV